MIFEYCTEDNVIIECYYDKHKFCPGVRDDPYGPLISPDEPAWIEVYDYFIKGEDVGSILSERMKDDIREQIKEATEED